MLCLSTNFFEEFSLYAKCHVDVLAWVQWVGSAVRVSGQLVVPIMTVH